MQTYRVWTGGYQLPQSAFSTIFPKCDVYNLHMHNSNKGHRNKGSVVIYVWELVWSIEIQNISLLSQQDEFPRGIIQ